MCNLAIERLKMTKNLTRRSHRIARRADQQGARAGKMGLAPDLEKKSTDLNTKTKTNIMKCKTMLHVSTFNIRTLHVFQQSELVASAEN